MKIAHFPNFLPTNQEMVYPQLLAAIKSTDELVEGDRNADADAALIWSVLWFGKMSGNKQVWDKYCNRCFGIAFWTYVYSMSF